MNDLSNTSKVSGTLLFLLLLASLIWRGTSNLSLLFISYCCITFAALSFFLFFRSRTILNCSVLPVLLISWLLWIIIPAGLGWVSNNAIPGFFQCSVWIMAFFIFSLNRSPELLWAMFLKTIWVLGIISAVYALIQFYIHHEMPSGFFASKNTGAAFLMIASLLLIGEWFASSANPESKTSQLEPSNITYSILLGGSIFILVFTLLLSLSRGAFLAWSIGLIFELILIRKQVYKKRIVLLLGLFSFALFCIFFLAQPAIEHRLDILQHEKSRFIIWEGAWHLWQQSPWYGIGIFNFAHYYPAFSLPGDGSSLQYVHNDFLQLLIETGVPGAFILLAIILTLLYSLCIYLKNKNINAQNRIKVIACFTALTAFVIHSAVDFNFYILPMNLILGCCLGYLHTAFKNDRAMPTWSFLLPSAVRKSICTLVIFGFLFSSVQFVRLVMLDHYSQKADYAIKHHDYNTAQLSNTLALKWFDDYEVHSYQADVYWQLANQPKVQDKNALIVSIKNELKSALNANPYYARPYFQMALLHAVLQNNPTKAEASFYKSLHNNPHFCLARITFALFFIEQNKLKEAQQVLEEGLSYPIPPEYAENYLSYLAKLRAASGNRNAANKVLDKLEELDASNSDYSELI